MSSHALASALDDYLSLTAPQSAEIYSRALALATQVEPNATDTLRWRTTYAPPAVVAMARLRLELAAEIERLIALLDFLDGDQDLEPSLAGNPGLGVHDGEADESQLGDLSWPETAGAGPSGMPLSAESDDDEDSDPASDLDDDNGIADYGGVQEQYGDLDSRGVL